MHHKCMILMTMSSLSIFFSLCFPIVPFLIPVAHPLTSSTPPPPVALLLYRRPSFTSCHQLCVPRWCCSALAALGPRRLHAPPLPLPTPGVILPWTNWFEYGVREVPPTSSLSEIRRANSHAEAKPPNIFGWRSHRANRGALPKEPYMYSLPTLEFRYII
jgi:hypothetical protein